MKAERETPQCNYKMKRGWWCSRRRGHIGPCALRPKWWNIANWNWGWPS